MIDDAIPITIVIYEKKFIDDVIPITIVFYEITNCREACSACYWLCKPNSFLGMTGLSRGPIRTKYEAPIMGCRVLSSPLKDNPNTTVIYGNSIFSRLAMPVTGCVNPL